MDYLYGPHLRPGRIPFLCRNGVEMEGNAFLCKTLHGIGIKLSPGEEQVALPCCVSQFGGKGGDGSFRGRDEGNQVSFAGGGGCRGGGYCLRVRIRAPVHFLDGGQRGLDAGDSLHHILGLAVHRFYGAGDVDNSKLPDLLKELFFARIHQDKVVFCHFCNHACSSSSSASWRVFTILDEALLRFSSSSIKRLIFLIAS